METEYEQAKKEVIFFCRFHPTDWFHEVGCPHMDWTKEQLIDAIRGLKVNLDRAHQQTCFPINGISTEGTKSSITPD